MESRSGISDRMHYRHEAIGIDAFDRFGMEFSQRRDYNIMNSLLETLRTRKGSRVAQLVPSFLLCFLTLTVYVRFPPGVVNTVPSYGSVGGAALAAHMDVDKVAFTGSTVTGRKIMEAAAKSNLKKV